ncbi:hypothetical protein C8J57DRAFT_1570393 [Mycena rebaudengoi]|nr:hypothetical protein C8J57DRAFT_1570393 [Mycena rebaudengoi]
MLISWISSAPLLRRGWSDKHYKPISPHTSTPIFTLPSELTAEKFLNFVPVYAARAHPRGIESPRLLGQICRTWREIAFSTPQLWRAIDLDLGQTPLASTHILHLDILSTWLARSKHCPLSISLKYARYAKADLAPLIVEITRHVWRWEHIELLLHNEDLRSVESDFPLLRSLTFGASDYVHEPGALDIISWFGAAPNLTDVALFEGCSPFTTVLPLIRCQCVC